MGRDGITDSVLSTNFVEAFNKTMTRHTGAERFHRPMNVCPYCRGEIFSYKFEKHLTECDRMDIIPVNEEESHPFDPPPDD